jgi:two-component system, sensor histidine kinase RegB
VNATAPLTQNLLLAAGPEAAELERTRINLRWLVRLRWGAAAGQLLTVLGSFYLLAMPLPLETLLALIATAAGSNLLAAAWLRRAARVPEEVLAGLMGLDVLVLTGLLALSGGPFNPFSTLYLIYIALAAVVLRPVWTWGLASFALACFGMLFVAPIRTEMEAMGQGAHGAHVRLHLEGMWVAFGVGAAFIVYFVQRVTSELARRDRELADVRSARARAEQLASLATLAAGAAHELASPLSTIAVVARELERRLGRASADVTQAVAANPASATGVEPLLEDARLIREQVDRCREILDRMAGDAGETPGEPFVELTLGELVTLSTGELGPGRVEIALDPASEREVRKLPRRAVAQALRALTKNALEASDGAKVVLDARIDEGLWTIEIRDQGHGMAADVLSRIGEPFFTTKGPGAGMGLGVFLARTVLASLGGELDYASRPGRGTTARVRLPALGATDPRGAHAATIH